MKKGAVSTLDHFIQWLYLKDQHGDIVSVRELTPNDNEAKAIFQLGEDWTKVTPYAYCNKHGLWAAPTATLEDDSEAFDDDDDELNALIEILDNMEKNCLTAENPGDKAAVVNKCVPVVEKLEGGKIQVTVSYPFETDDFVDWIWVKDQQGSLFGVKKLSITDGEAVAGFSVGEEGITKITAFIHTTQHGTWSATESY